MKGTILSFFYLAEMFPAQFFMIFSNVREVQGPYKPEYTRETLENFVFSNFMEVYWGMLHILIKENYIN